MLFFDDGKDNTDQFVVICRNHSGFLDEQRIGNGVVILIVIQNLGNVRLLDETVVIIANRERNTAVLRLIDSYAVLNFAVCDRHNSLFESGIDRIADTVDDSLDGFRGFLDVGSGYASHGIGDSHENGNGSEPTLFENLIGFIDNALGCKGLDEL